MTDDVRLRDPLPLIGHLPPMSAVIVRDRDPARALARAEALASGAGGGPLILVALPAPPEKSTSVDGFHVPERALTAWTRTAVRRLGPLLLTVSAHDGRAIRRAARFGADAVLVSPVLPTKSHPGARVLGPMRLAALIRTSPLPVYALGGIGVRDVRRILALGAAGVAGIGLFVDG